MNIQVLFGAFAGIAFVFAVLGGLYGIYSHDEERPAQAKLGLKIFIICSLAIPFLIALAAGS